MAPTDKNEAKALWRFFRLIKAERKQVFLIYAYAIFYGVIQLSLPLGIQAIINLVTGGQFSSSWLVLVILVILGLSFSGMLQLVQLSIIENLQQKIFFKSALEFAWRIPRFKTESLEGHYPPELVNRFFDTLSVQKGLAKLLMDFSLSSLQIVFGLVLLTFYHPFFVFFGTALILVVFVIFRFTGPVGLTTNLKESKYKYAVAHWLEEMARTMDTFKLIGQTDLHLKKTDQLVSGYLTARKKHFQILVLQYASMIGFKVIVVAGLLILGSLLVVNQQINLGQFVAAEIVIILIINAVEKLILSMETAYDVLTAIEKIGYVTDLPLEREKGIDFSMADTGKGMEVSLVNVSYKFPNAREYAVKDINITIAPNEKVCIAGHNVSGKSTLLYLISALYHDYGGYINYNKVPLKNYNITSLRSYIGDCLSQEDIFNGTVEENIVMGRNLSFQHLTQVAEQLNLSGFINSLPEGYNTVLGPDGENVSNSRKKKILLARSIIDNPSLLLVEELIDQLEKEEKEKILNVLFAPDAPWTLIGVSNDWKFISRCDKVLFMDKGSVVFQGPPDQLKQLHLFENLFSTI